MLIYTKTDVFYLQQVKQTQQFYPAISRVYSCHRKTIMNNVLTQENVELIGDGRFDSPGFSATYGTYTIIDEKTTKLSISLSLMSVTSKILPI